MIDGALIRRLLILSALLSVLSTGVALAVARSPALAGGIAAGFVLGAAPMASWAWLVRRGLRGPRGGLRAVITLLLKMAFYAGVLWLLVMRQGVDGVGVLAGLTGEIAILTVGLLAGTRARPREAA